MGIWLVACSPRQLLLEIRNYRNYHKCVARIGTTRKNACNRETMRMMKIRVVIIFMIAQVVLAK